MARILARGQVTIPVAVRKKFNLEPGDNILFIEEDGRLVIRRAWGI